MIEDLAWGQCPICFAYHAHNMNECGAQMKTFYLDEKTNKEFDNIWQDTPASQGEYLLKRALKQFVARKLYEYCDRERKATNTK